MQDDLIKFVSDPTSPFQVVNILEEVKDKGKERREVSEGDDTVTIEDTSDEEDAETLQERFHAIQVQQVLTVNSCIKVRLVTCKRTSLPS
jgi:hypothetical protein